jgi:pimeloyl-ACP methyl ester carboxylesterase
VPRPPAIVTPAFTTASAVQRRLPATRAVLPYVPADADSVRLPVGPGALHALRYGHGGPTVLLIHGFTTSTPLWLSVAPLLLAQGCQVLVPDLLGFGESDRPVGGPYNIGAQARYLDRALALLRVHAVVAVGQDVGGLVAARLAAIRPERVSAIVQCSPPPDGGAGGPEIDGVQDQTGPALLDISSRPLGVVDLLRPVLRSAVSDVATMPDRLIARFSAPYTGGQGARHLLDLARSVTEDSTEAPVQLRSDVTPFRVTGEDDPLVATPAAPRVRLQGATRLLPLEQPAALAELILERVVVSIESLGTLEKRAPTE